MKIGSLITTFLLIFLLSVFHPFSAGAQMGNGMMGNTDTNDTSSSSSQIQQNQKKLDGMVNDILSSQRVSSVGQLDCKKISQDTLEQLGDTWMDVMIPNESAHQRMDNMMGGDGSQNLRNAHIAMAENYLGCQGSGHTTYGWMPMMAIMGGAFPMMGWGNYGYGNMGGWYGTVGIFASLFWIVGLIVLILLGVFLWKKIRK